ncbi:MAG: hypothetical protein IT210_17325 [Armatimonadetes bacterium]|nr:hypothetical protein [Armatimonadota bacterium]
MAGKVRAWVSKIWNLRKAPFTCTGCIRTLEAGSRYYIHPKTGEKLCPICYEARLYEERRFSKPARASSR